MKNITEDEHQELMVYLEELIRQMNKWVLTKCKKGERLFDKFMSYPYLKLVNDTFVELLNEEVIKGLEKHE